MIDLSEFNDLVPNMGRGAADQTRISVTETSCRIIFSKKDYDLLVKYFGVKVNVKYNADLSTIVVVRGADRRIGSMNRDISIAAMRERLQKVYGGAIKNIYFDTAMDNDQNGTAVFVLRHNGRKEFNLDATVRKLKG